MDVLPHIGESSNLELKQVLYLLNKLVGERQLQLAIARQSPERFSAASTPLVWDLARPKSFEFKRCPSTGQKLRAN